MSQKKSNTQQSTDEAPAYNSFNSFQLTDEQIGRALAVFEDELLQDPQGDVLAGNLLVILKAFTFTRDHYRREGMLIAAEAALMPFIGVASTAINNLSIKTHQQITKEGGTH